MAKKLNDMDENKHRAWEKLADKLSDNLMSLANLLLLALVVGQVFSPRPFNMFWAFVGAAACIILYVSASLLVHLMR